MDTKTEVPGGTADLNKLKAEFSQLRADISELSATMKTLIAEKAKEGKHKAQETLDQTGQKIGEHPFMSMLIALGAGFLVGFLIERNRSA
jgi:ElaB/YqjD/DUF883 family membrane-anchored ribosome-binding protein